MLFIPTSRNIKFYICLETPCLSRAIFFIQVILFYLNNI